MIGMALLLGQAGLFLATDSCHGFFGKVFLGFFGTGFLAWDRGAGQHGQKGARKEKAGGATPGSSA